MRGRIRSGLVPLALVLVGCASIRAVLPDGAPTVSKPASIVPAAAPVAPPPATVQTLTLASPDGARGRLTLIKTISYVRQAEGDPKNPAKTCEFCTLHLLCRIAELREGDETDE